MFALTFSDCFASAFSKADARAALAQKTAFLLLAFLWAFFSKEKRLKIFAIKGLLTLFLLKIEPQKKKLCKKKMGVFVELRAPHRATVRGAPLLKKWTKQSRKVSANIPINQNSPPARCHSGGNPAEILSLRSRMTIVATR